MGWHHNHAIRNALFASVQSAVLCSSWLTIHNHQTFFFPPGVRLPWCHAALDLHVISPLQDLQVWVQRKLTSHLANCWVSLVPWLPSPPHRSVDGAIVCFLLLKLFFKNCYLHGLYLSCMCNGPLIPDYDME